MDILERIKKLAASRNLSINSLEEKLGFARGYLYTWKKKTPGIDRVQKVADFFDVSVDYLLGKSDIEKPKSVELTDNDVIMTFEGKPIQEEDRELIKRLLRGK